MNFLSRTSQGELSPSSCEWKMKNEEGVAKMHLHGLDHFGPAFAGFQARCFSLWCVNAGLQGW
jgi:hypothetical protein